MASLAGVEEVVSVGEERQTEFGARWDVGDVGHRRRVETCPQGQHRLGAAGAEPAGRSVMGAAAPASRRAALSHPVDPPELAPRRAPAGHAVPVLFASSQVGDW